MPPRKELSKLIKSRMLVTMTGASPFCMDNIRGADVEDPTTMKIKELADKKGKMTSEERELKENLQWRHRLYQDETGALTFPYRNLIIALGEAGSALKLKTAIIDRGAIQPGGVDMTFGYFGPDNTDWTGRSLSPGDLKEMYNDHRFRLRAVVNGNPSAGKRKSMIATVRPQFQQWVIQADLTIWHDEIDESKFMKILETTGRQGLGNARKIGMGRFEASVKEL